MPDQPSQAASPNVAPTSPNLSADHLPPLPTASGSASHADHRETPADSRRSPPQPAAAASQANSHATTPNSSSTPPAGQQQAQAKDTQNEMGHIPQAYPTPGSGPAKVLLSPTGQPLARDSKGRLYNPAKGEPAPKQIPHVRNLETPKPLQDNELERKGGIDGLSTIPKDWPELPPNVSLGQEIAWVQSERLRVVKEQTNGRVKVDLSKARVPAPSMSALSWLETSIRSYAKFVEVASKQASSGQDEAEFVRKERMAIVEIRAVLQEMMPASG